MATKADDKKELDISTVDPNMPIPRRHTDTVDMSTADPNMPIQTRHRDTACSGVAIGDELTSIDELRSGYKNNPTKYGIVRVEAGPDAKEAAAGKLLSSEKLPTSKFIIVVNNMTDHDLIRSASSGSDSWPFSSIKKKECVAALYDHSHFENLNAVFTADDDQPGLRTVMLSAHLTDRGRSIGIYAGKAQANSKKINHQKVHDHGSKRNKAAIDNPGSYYLYWYDINRLQYAQFGVVAGNEAATEAIEKFNIFSTGSMPGFTFVVNNLTGYDLILSEKYKVEGSWPLGDIKKGECAVAGFDQLSMSLAACYSASVDDQLQKSISLAGIWPLIGSRKIYAGEGMKSIDAWKRLSEDHQNWPMEEGADDRLNSAYIQVEQGYSGKSCVYVYVLRKL